MGKSQKILAVLLLAAFAISIGAQTVSTHDAQLGADYLISSGESETEGETETGDQTEGETEDEDEDEIEDGIEEENDRNVQVEVSGGEISIESEKDNPDGTEDEIQFVIKTEEDSLRIQMSYSEEANDEEMELETEIELRKLIEFNDTNDNSLYDRGTDDVYQEVTLDSFNAPLYATFTNENGDLIHNITVVSTDGVFKAEFFMSEEFSIVNGSLITPVEMKFNIIIDGFSYSDPESKLAMYTVLESETEYEHEDETEDEKEGFAEDEEGLKTSVNDADYSGKFSWAQNAWIDGIKKPVNSTSIESDHEDSSKEKIYLVYEQGGYIFHDPKVGLNGILSGLSSSNGGTIGLPGSGLLILGFTAIGLIGLIIVTKKRIRS